MRKTLLWKATWLISSFLMFNLKAYGDASGQTGTLSNESCWYEYKEELSVTSMNDKSFYNGSIKQIKSELEGLIAKTLLKDLPIEFSEMDISLHCGGYGASLVARITDRDNSYCLWTSFKNGMLGLRSFGSLNNKNKNPNELCTGHVGGEFMMGSNSEEFVKELQSAKWSSMISSVTSISSHVYKIILVKEFQFREQEAILQIEESFNRKNYIRYIEFNEFNHPVGEFIHLDI